MSCIFYQSKRALEESIKNINHIDESRAELGQGSSDLPEPVLEAVALARRAIWTALDTLAAVNPVLPSAPGPGYLYDGGMHPRIRVELAKLKHVEKSKAVLAATVQSELGSFLLQCGNEFARLRGESTKIIQIEDLPILLAVGNPAYLEALRVWTWEPQASLWLASGPVDLVWPGTLVKQTHVNPQIVSVNLAPTGATKKER